VYILKNIKTIVNKHIFSGYEEKQFKLKRSNTKRIARLGAFDKIK
jgi:hypothetical protein